MAEINESATPYLAKNVVGKWDKNRNKIKQPFTNDYKRITDYKRIAELAVFTKAVRRVGGYLGLRIGEREIISLSMVWMWCWQFNAEGGPISKIMGWSGYNRKWLGKIKNGINDCIKLGLIDQVPLHGGIRLKVSSKGESVMKALELQMDIVIEEMEGKREKPKRKFYENRIRTSE